MGVGTDALGLLLQARLMTASTHVDPFASAMTQIARGRLLQRNEQPLARDSVLASFALPGSSVVREKFPSPAAIIFREAASPVQPNLMQLLRPTLFSGFQLRKESGRSAVQCTGMVSHSYGFGGVHMNHHAVATSAAVLLPKRAGPNSRSLLR